ncbi:MAG: WYL domain-containing protein [Anaerovibrio sp.]|nr:WYL domain-containing protein [Anaerovibrio sp.]
MDGTGNKRLLNMYILNILREYSDENHALTQQDILKQLESDYDVICDRRTVKAYVDEWIELGWDIVYDKGYKLISREFDDAELHILIDSVLFSKSISTRQAQTLIKKLQGFASKYFNAKVSHVCNLPDLNRTVNRQAMYALGIINDAISAKKKIEFIYNEMGTDFKLHPKRKDPYVVNPYQIVANNGKFYLIANYDKYDNVVHFRIDKMKETKCLNESIKPRSEVPELANGLNLPKHMAEHIYMFSGESVWAEIKTTPDMMGELVDWFGKDFKIEQKEDGYIIIRVKCNGNALRYWALQYGPYVEILKPVKLREQLKQDAENMYRKYSDQ